ncbi:hypothetical protein [Psychrobacillus glaciei]|uniref:hypothetical protein n=1 Tax=Psychrobacillus glaciei TaxID=2283160 RepID=UPI00298F46FC|nr:hypothetical protein [Psychrobacillus glaciei]
MNFDLPEHILKERILKGQRSTTILRTVSSFDEVLTRQEGETNKGDVVAPTEGESDHLFVIENVDEVQSVIRDIVTIAQS